ncbi:MAG: hypothetical protein AAFV37_02135, partial [Pseudomonadota bacterium]
MRNVILKNRLFTTTVLASALAVSLGSGVAQAQEADTTQIESPSEDQTSVQDKVVVTGSRIRRDSNLDSSIPVTTVGADELLASSAFNAAEVIRQLPQFGIPGLTSTKVRVRASPRFLRSIVSIPELKTVKFVVVDVSPGMPNCGSCLITSAALN